MVFGFKTSSENQQPPTNNQKPPTNNQPPPNMSEPNNITINETIDGVAVEGLKRVSKPQPKAVARQKPDTYIWGIYIALLVVSVIELFSASSTEVSGENVYMPLIRHGIFLVLGFGIVLAFQKIPYIVFSRLSYPFALLSLGLLLLSNIFGIEINGAQRAISIAGFTLQPAEIVKLSVVVLLAAVLGRNQRKGGGITARGSLIAAIVVVLFAGLLWKNGLTNTILLFVVSVSMFLIGGMKWKQFGIIMCVYAAFGGMLYMFKYDDKPSEFDRVGTTTVQEQEDRSGTHKNRIQRFFEGVSPDDEMTDINRQEMLARMAQAHGGVFGQGPGNSRESARLPLAFSDYIYSIIVEDTGLVGGLFLLCLYLMLLARAGRITLKLKRALPAFLIMGCGVLIVFQALVHIAIVTGCIPVSGQPLPFISKGGTSVLVMSAAIGIMLSVSRFAVSSDDKKEIKEELKELPKEMRGANFSDVNNQ